MSLEGYAIKDIEKVIIGIDGRKVTKVDIARLSAPGENYLSLVFSVDILVEDRAGRRETIKAVAKRLPLVEMKFNMSAMMMKNEIKFYSKIEPLLREFAKEYEFNTDYYPKYLGSRLSLDPEETEPDAETVLFIKNLLPEGYINEDRHIGFDLEAAKAILKTLARFHGIPLAMKFKNPEFFEVIKKTLEHPNFSGPPKNGPPEDAVDPDDLMWENIVKIPACQPYVSNLKKLQENLLPMPERFIGGGKEPWNTVSHNDFWVNNMLIKVPGYLVKLLDFQGCSYSSFARDLVFFLLTSVRDEIQQTHFDDLLRYYYDELTAVLVKIHVPKLKFSYEEYLEEVNRVATKLEVSHALTFCNVIFAVKGAQKDHLTGEVDMFEKMKEMMNNMGERQKEKIGLVVKLCVRRGWL
ncbi:uncharacterized protein [Euwallacea similis]|uniref:uncharacterized protein n=1 Tax=Euwallacea similis TaxID=1736056 RepID=UPI00344E9036